MTKRRRSIRFSLLSLFVLTTLVAGSIGGKQYWEYRKEEKRLQALFATDLPRAWINAFLANEPPPPVAGMMNPGVRFDFRGDAISPPDQLRILDYGARSFSTDERLGALRLLISHFSTDDWMPVMRSLAADCDDVVVRRTALKYLVAHKTDDTAFLLSRTKDRDAECRAVAIDGFGIAKTRQIDPSFWMSYRRCAHLEYGLREQNKYSQSHGNDDIVPNASFSRRDRRRVAKWMRSAETAGEREAAARVLTFHPPKDYELRLAEWGVWINTGGNMRLLKSVLDEIPEFVDRTTGSPTTVVHGYFEREVGITKPIVHLTASQPLAVNLAVRIREGTPCFAYPRPDHLELGRTTLTSEPWKLSSNFDTTVPGLRNVFTLWKIDKPPNRLEQQKYIGKYEIPNSAFYIQTYTSMVSSLRTRTERLARTFVGNGLQWQAMMVTPNEHPWMVKPKVDDKYQWWKILRDVPSSWVTSNGETERFVYYDGPTRLPAGFSVVQTGATIEIKTTAPPEEGPSSDEVKTDGQTGSQSFADQDKAEMQKHHPARFMAEQGSQLPAFVIRSEQGKTTGIEIPKFGYGTFDLKTLPSFGEAELKKRLSAAIVQAGLTKEETAGLIGAWESGFFKDEGSRLISFLSAAEYDNYCPLQMNPPATEQARVGLVLSVLD